MQYIMYLPDQSPVGKPLALATASYKRVNTFDDLVELGFKETAELLEYDDDNLANRGREYIDHRKLLLMFFGPQQYSVTGTVSNHDGFFQDNCAPCIYRNSLRCVGGVEVSDRGECMQSRELKTVERNMRMRTPPFILGVEILLAEEVAPAEYRSDHYAQSLAREIRQKKERGVLYLLAPIEKTEYGDITVLPLYTGHTYGTGELCLGNLNFGPFPLAQSILGNLEEKLDQTIVAGAPLAFFERWLRGGFSERELDIPVDAPLDIWLETMRERNNLDTFLAADWDTEVYTLSLANIIDISESSPKTVVMTDNSLAVTSYHD